MKQSSKPISSPSRTDLFPPPLMSFLRADSGNRSKTGRSRSSPIFPRKKNVTAIETQDPSSPKVTCMGQVRTNKRSSNKTPAARCWWIRSVLSFNRRHCRNFWNRSALLFRRTVVNRRKPSISESRVGNETEDEENDNDNDDDVFASSIPSPPKNALILTRCRSTPHRASYYGNRYRSSAMMRSDGSGEEEEEEKTEAVLNSIGEGDSEWSVNGREMKMEEETMLNRKKLILTRCKSEPGRIAEKLYGEEERSVMAMAMATATNDSCLLNKLRLND